MVPDGEVDVCGLHSNMLSKAIGIQDIIGAFH